MFRGSVFRRGRAIAGRAQARLAGPRPCKLHIEGINSSRGEAGETIHHLFIVKPKGYIDQSVYNSYRSRYKECIRMLNGLEKSLEKHLPESGRRWTAQGDHLS